MNWKRAGVAAIGTIPVLALFAFGFTRDPGEIASPLPGNPAPAFDLVIFAPGKAALARPVGDTIRLAEQTGNVVVMNFWASWCLACRDEHAALSETALAYADDSVQFVGLLYNDRTVGALRWIEEMGGQSYPSVLDQDSRTAIDYGLYGVPETFIIDREGRIAVKHLGPISERQLRHWVDSLLMVPGGTVTTGGAAR
ncbi:MAG: TlpA family protein disulfide reductase [Gemmatimonadaceae bacterium]